jgi:error-prone DNA polymerase
VALLDRDGVYGAPQLYRAAKAAGLRAIVGAELTLTGAQSHPSTGAQEHQSTGAPEHQSTGAPEHQSTPWTLPVLVSSPEGYRNLCRLITRAKSIAPKGESRLTLTDLDGCTGGLIALVGRPALVAERHGVGGLVDQVVGVFGRNRVWIELQRHLQRDEEAANASLLDLAAAFRVPVMASNGVRFAAPEDRPVFDVLTCLRHKTTLAKAGRRLSVNAERYLKPPDMSTLPVKVIGVPPPAVALLPMFIVPFISVSGLAIVRAAPDAPIVPRPTTKMRPVPKALSWPA